MSRCHYSSVASPTLKHAAPHVQFGTTCQGDEAPPADGELAFRSPFLLAEAVIRSRHRFSSVFVCCFSATGGVLRRNALISRATEQTHTSNYTSPFSCPEKEKKTTCCYALLPRRSTPSPLAIKGYWVKMIVFLNLQLWGLFFFSEDYKLPRSGSHVTSVTPTCSGVGFAMQNSWTLALKITHFHSIGPEETCY